MGNFITWERVFNQLINKILAKTGAKHLEFELWNEYDPSKIIFDEIGIELDDGEWIYDC